VAFAFGACTGVLMTAHPSRPAHRERARTRRVVRRSRQSLGGSI
jgi:hypothetical protein